MSRERIKEVAADLRDMADRIGSRAKTQRGLVNSRLLRGEGTVADTAEAREVPFMVNTNDMTELEILARTIYGEARGESLAGRVAVANVITNRLAKAYQGYSIKEICFRRYQFSCWLENDPNLATITSVDERDKIYAECCVIAELAYNMLLDDNTRGAKHYHVSSSGFPKTWGEAKTPCAIIGRHSFYNDVK